MLGSGRRKKNVDVEVKKGVLTGPQQPVLHHCSTVSGASPRSLKLANGTEPLAEPGCIVGNLQ